MLSSMAKRRILNFNSFDLFTLPCVIATPLILNWSLEALIFWGITASLISSYFSVKLEYLAGGNR
jgi:hypothetical protein